LGLSTCLPLSPSLTFPSPLLFSFLFYSISHSSSLFFTQTISLAAFNLNASFRISPILRLSVFEPVSRSLFFSFPLSFLLFLSLLLTKSRTFFFFNKTALTWNHPSRIPAQLLFFFIIFHQLKDRDLLEVIDISTRIS